MSNHLGGKLVKSPVRFLLSIAILCILLSIVLDQIGSRIDLYGLNNYSNEDGLTLPRYYWRTGQLDKAINEYVRIISDAPALAPLAYKDLNRLIEIESGRYSWVFHYIVYDLWVLPPRLFLLGTAFMVIGLFVLLFNRLKKRPLFVILPFQDRASLGFENNFSIDVVDRLKELVWRDKNLESTSNLIIENFELPLIGLIGENNAIDSAALLETALALSGTPSDFPLSRLLNSIRLWLEQPRYWVRGQIIRSPSGYILNIRLLQYDRKDLVKSWHVDIKGNDEDVVNQVIDSIIFILLSFFNVDVLQTKSWLAFKYMQEGLDNIFVFEDNPRQSAYLQTAVKKMRMALNFDPSYPLARHNLGLLLMQIGDYDEARDVFKSASETFPNLHFRKLALFNYGVALYHLNQLWAYKRSAKIFEQLLEEKNGLDENFILLLHSVIALTYSRLGSIDKSDRGEYFRLALNEADMVLKNNEITDECRANAYSAKGYVKLFEGDFSGAIQYLNDAVKANPTNIIHWIGLGQAYWKAKKLEQAAAVFEKADFMSISSGYASYKLGNIYREMGEIDKAIDAYKRAPSVAESHIAQGKILLENREYVPALQAFRSATKINRRLTEAWVNIAWTILEMEAENDDLLKEAERSARRALQLEKNRNQIWHRHAVLARVLIAMDKNESAYKEALKSVNHSPHKVQAIYYQAVAEYKLGYYSKAMANAKKVLELDKGEWRIASEILIGKIEREIDDQRNKD